MAIGTKKIEDFIPVVKYNQGIYSEYDIQTTTNLVVGGNLTVAGDISLTDDITVDSLTATNTITVDSSSASALTVGNNGATNPVLKVDASTASVATGISITGAAAASGVAVAVISSGTNENLTLDAKGSGTVTVNGTGTGAITLARATGVTGAVTVTSAAAAALSVGANGATNPVLSVDASTSSAATGLAITGAAAAGGLGVAVISSGTNEALTLNAKGSGTITLGNTSTGNINAVRKLLVMSATTLPAGGATGQGIQIFTTSNLGIFAGSGAPTLTAAKGALYLRSDGTGTGDRAYINTDSGTTWTALTTAA